MVPFPGLTKLSPEMMKEIEEDMQRRVEEGARRIEEIRDRFVKTAIPLDQLTVVKGPFHAASILAWTTLARYAKVPHIRASCVATIPIADAWAYLDRKPMSEAGVAAVQAAEDYAHGGGFWRTDVCAGEFVKYIMGSGQELPEVIPFTLDDPRIMDMSTFLPEIKVIGRPRVTPQRVNDYPVEFRVYIGGAVTGEMATSFYYPQAGHFEVSSVLQTAMNQAELSARMLWGKVMEYGLVPWIPDQGEPDIGRGCSLDFMLTDRGEVTLVDAGPGLGSGAHPCCFLDVETVSGQKWHVDDGVEIR